ncbi:hypothetical protein [Phytoactinopolyspora limicola]|uniref:hypothetical protein n=1 Tax=Phytoactinopolyspora limicola TaxID=2715536 RepID=UPI00140A70EB|nr:hypothetical protein [Phytoactinopolyspora limicola]
MSTSVPSGRPPGRLSLDSLGTDLRPILLAMAGGAVLLVVIVLLAIPDTGDGVGVAIVLAIGLALAVAAWWMPGARLTPLDPTQRADPAAAAQLLRGTGFLAMALAETPVLVGVVVSFVTGGWLPALAGGVIGTAALLSLGPTRPRLELWKERLEVRGARTGL